MDKGYYDNNITFENFDEFEVAIHNKNGQGLLQKALAAIKNDAEMVAIHNKNGKGLLPT